MNSKPRDLNKNLFLGGGTIIVILLIAALSTLNSIGQGTRRMEARRLESEQISRFVELRSQGSLVNIRKLRGGLPASTEIGCGSSCSGFVYGEYEIENTFGSTLDLWSNWWSCDFPDGIDLAPYQKIVVYCAEDNGGINMSAYIGLELQSGDGRVLGTAEIVVEEQK